MNLKPRFWTLLLLPLFAPGLLIADAPFPQPAVSLDAGTSPRGIGTGDVFGKGTLDLVVANFGSPTFIGQSTPASLLAAQNSSLQVFAPSPGGLRLAATVPTASSPRGLSFLRPKGGDRAYILVTCYDANLLQVFGWQGGKFVKVDEAPTLKMPVGIAAGTTRRGGAPFVAVADYGADSLSLYPVKNGKLGPRTDIPMPGGPIQVAVGDLNGDGFNEVAVACMNVNKIEILTVASDDPSAYTHLETLALPDGSSPSDLRLADLNRDGKTDLVAADFSANRVLTYLQKPDGTLSAQAPLTTSGSHPNGLTVADLGGTQGPAILVANRDSDTLDIFQASGQQYQLARTLKVADDSGSGFGPVEVAVLDGEGQDGKIIVTSHMRSNTLKVLAVGGCPESTPTPSIGAPAGGYSFSQDTTYCYPNPAHGGDVKIRFDLPAPGAVSVRVFNLVGERVWSRDLGASQTQAGTNTLDWNLSNQAGQNLASGTYLCSVTAGDRTVTRKLAVIR